jgi:predicted secreted Zn-dependent protease
VSRVSRDTARDSLATGGSLLSWQKSTHSTGNGNCVEVAALPDDNLAVRDSKDKTGPMLQFSASEWRAFVAGVKDGEFDNL